MSWVHALLLGVLEGLTEFLPVSSTGHLILFAEWLGTHDEAGKTLDIVIRLGAVIAVLVYYRVRFAALLHGVLARDSGALRLAASLAIGFLPAAVVGLAFHRIIKERLFGPRPVAAALIVGGVVMIAVEAWRGRQRHTGLEGVEHVTPLRALAIGVAQCASLWPGASRSMSTIVGGQLAGLSTATAAEFSFLLAVPTLGAATLYDLYKNGRTLLAAPGGVTALAAGMGAAFVVSLLVIAAFLRYLKRFGLAPFGVYRIVLGAVVLLVTNDAPVPATENGGSRNAGSRGEVAALFDSAGPRRRPDRP